MIMVENEEIVGKTLSAWKKTEFLMTEWDEIRKLVTGLELEDVEKCLKMGKSC